MVIQAYEYEKNKSFTENSDEFWNNAEKYIQGKELEEYFIFLKDLRSQK